MSADWTREGSEHWWAEVDTAPRCTCGQRLERIPGKGGELYDCPLECGEVA